MKRDAFTYLEAWLNSHARLPLIIRGARQVGKTYMVRKLAKKHNLTLLEFNFEQTPDQANLFQSNDPHNIIRNIEAHFEIDINIEKSLLFLDEIQAAPQLLGKLRWFAEQLPQLAVTAAGSLLEFVLEDHNFSMPVGRITYIHLEPLSFEEFLTAKGKIKSLDFICQYRYQQTVPISIHQQLSSLFKEYLIVGGMPAAVHSWIQQGSLGNIHRIHNDLLTTYRDDFSKYSKKISTSKLDEVMNAIPKLLGEKFVYTRVNKETKTTYLKEAFNLLCKARIAHKVKATVGNGVPLASEVNDKFFKATLLDTGLISTLLGFKLNQLDATDDITLINQGGLSEQVTAQILRTLDPFYVEPSLYYWHREAKSSNAEIDYLIQHHNTVVPIEVKSGSTGSLKSLHWFMANKQFEYAIRINSGTPSVTPISTRLHDQKIAEYTLLSMPFYLTGQLYRLLDEYLEEA